MAELCRYRSFLGLWSKFQSISSAFDQPKHFPDRSYFRFPKCYHGEASLESLTEMIKGALSGANFTKVYGPASQYKCYSLHCLHSVRNTSKSQTYNHDTYRQIGVKNETIKRTKTLGMLNSIEHMSGKEETDTIWATKSSKVSGCLKNQPSRQQVYSGRKSSDNEHCCCKIVYFMWPDGYYYLDHKSYLDHNGHRFIPLSFSFHKMHSIPDESLELIERSSTLGLRLQLSETYCRSWMVLTRGFKPRPLVTFFINLKSWPTTN